MLLNGEPIPGLTGIEFTPRVPGVPWVGMVGHSDPIADIRAGIEDIKSGGPRPTVIMVVSAVVDRLRDWYRVNIMFEGLGPLRPIERAETLRLSSIVEAVAEPIILQRADYMHWPRWQPLQSQRSSGKRAQRRMGKAWYR